MAPLKEYLQQQDQLLVDKFLEDPVKFQEIRKVLEPNVKTEAHTQIPAKINKAKLQSPSLRSSKL